jgi:hypothetical protein
MTVALLSPQALAGWSILVAPEPASQSRPLRFIGSTPFQTLAIFQYQLTTGHSF